MPFRETPASYSRPAGQSLGAGILGFLADALSSDGSLTCICEGTKEVLAGVIRCWPAPHSLRVCSGTMSWHMSPATARLILLASETRSVAGGVLAPTDYRCSVMCADRVLNDCSTLSLAAAMSESTVRLASFKGKLCLLMPA